MSDSGSRESLACVWRWVLWHALLVVARVCRRGAVCVQELRARIHLCECVCGPAMIVCLWVHACVCERAHVPACLHPRVHFLHNLVTVQAGSGLVCGHVSRAISINVKAPGSQDPTSKAQDLGCQPGAPSLRLRRSERATSEEASACRPQTAECSARSNSHWRCVAMIVRSIELKLCQIEAWL